MFEKKVKLWLFLILIIASILRLWKLNTVPISLYSDEVDVGYQAYSILKTGKDYFGNSWPFFFQSYSDNRTPLYIYSTVPTVALFGITPLGVRLPSVFFGVLGIYAFYLLIKEMTDNKTMALLSGAVLTISPWDIQFSRIAFEATEMLFFLLLGMYFFFRSINTGKNYIGMSFLFFGLTPWVYSTAKFFIPILLIFLAVMYKSELFKILKDSWSKTLIVILVLWLPLLYLTVFGKFNSRFNYISIFTNPTTISDTGYARQVDAQFLGPDRLLLSKLESRMVHNKYMIWVAEIIHNYLETFSTQFLFLSGDPNLRQSPQDVGQLYKIEFVTLAAGCFFFFTKYKDNKIKWLVLFWLVIGSLPSELTRIGGTHATRLILILPVLGFLIAFGILEGSSFMKRYSKFALSVYCIFLFINIILYEHNYFVHYPWYSERAFSSGYENVISHIKKYEKDFDKVIITNSLDQPYIFLAAYYPIEPSRWQAGLADVDVNGFGKLKHFDKYYFGQMGEEGTDSLPGVLDGTTLYIAAAREFKDNLVLNSDKLPAGLHLTEVISYPSGEPAFYFLTKDLDYISTVQEL